MRRPGGYVGGQPLPVIERVTIEVDGEVTREHLRALLSAALTDLGRPDIIVAND